MFLSAVFNYISNAADTTIANYNVTKKKDAKKSKEIRVNSVDSGFSSGWRVLVIFSRQDVTSRKD